MAVQLAIIIDERQPGRWVNGDTIGYVRTGKGNAIDFGPVAVPTPIGTAHTTPLEAKWVTQGWRSEALITETALAGGVPQQQRKIGITGRAQRGHRPVLRVCPSTRKS